MAELDGSETAEVGKDRVAGCCDGLVNRIRSGGGMGRGYGR